MKNHENFEFYAAFGGQVRRFRKALGMTQQALAEKIGLSRTSITNIEKGEQQVLLHQVFHLARALSVRPEDMLHGHAKIDSDKITKMLPEGMDEDVQAFVKSIASN